jgi:hypothetical protein
MFETDADLNSLPRVETSTKANTRLASLMEKESIPGNLERFTMENGIRERKQAMESGKPMMVSPTWASGKTASQTAMAFINGVMATSMKESGSSACDMEMVQISSQTATSTLDSTSMENLRASDSTRGAMAATTPANSNLGSNKGTENGKRRLPMAATPTRESTSTTRSTGRDFSSGKAETNT